MLGALPAVLEQLNLQAGAMAGIAIDLGPLLVEPRPRTRYTMAELLAASDYSQLQPAEEREWIDLPSVAGEPL
jgi:antitoxin ChpS